MTDLEAKFFDEAKLNLSKALNKFGEIYKIKIEIEIKDGQFGEGKFGDFFIEQIDQIAIEWDLFELDEYLINFLNSYGHGISDFILKTFSIK